VAAKRLDQVAAGSVPEAAAAVAQREPGAVEVVGAILAPEVSSNREGEEATVSSSCRAEPAAGAWAEICVASPAEARRRDRAMHFRVRGLLCRPSQTLLGATLAPVGMVGVSLQHRRNPPALQPVALVRRCRLLWSLDREQHGPPHRARDRRGPRSFLNGRMRFGYYSAAATPGRPDSSTVRHAVVHAFLAQHRTLVCALFDGLQRERIRAR
jgi:hypothetical protein